jgi:transcriptional regulator GlxA family with amidase domain
MRISYAALLTALLATGSRAVAADPDAPKNVAILLYEGVQIIDYTGPYEVLGQVRGFRVYTVSETGKTLTTAMGMSVNPKYDFATAPAPDLLVVPGGNAEAAYDNPRVVDWVRERAASAEYVMSVCNGAFILAKAGLLDGKKATTFYGLIDELRTFAPKTEVVTDQRFVDNGKVITTAGLSSGIDGALHLVAKIRGEAKAKAVALHIEYDWNPESKFARAALADLRLPNVEPPEGAVVTVLASAGDRDHWEKRIRLATAMSKSELESYLSQRIAALDGWSKEGTSWTRVAKDGSRWKSFSTIEPEREGSYVVTFRIERRRA